MRFSLSIFLSRLINITLGIVAFFLVLRILLKMFAANPQTPFVDFIYQGSNFLMVPFRGIFTQPTIQSATLDIPAIIALIMYSLISYLASALVDNLTQPKHIHSYERH